VGGRACFRGGATAPTAASGWIEITYLGEQALSLTGPITGARYHFGWRGAILPVDRRDAPTLLLRDDLRVSS
jgi:hypothetical protein